MSNPTIENDIAEILKDLPSGQKEIMKEISDVKVSLEGVKGDIKILNTSIKELDKRVSNQEFTNRGVLIGLILALLGGAVKLFGWMPNS